MQIKPNQIKSNQIKSNQIKSMNNVDKHRAHKSPKIVGEKVYINQFLF
jgi:hypothetical protein